MPRIRLRFDCDNPSCEGVIAEEVHVSEPDYGAERMSDGDAWEDFDFACPECGKDYSVETVSSFSGISATVDQSFEADVERLYEPDYYDFDQYLLRYDPANDTIGAYEDARDELLALLAIHGRDPTSILNRMIFSQLIAIMEAYLSDKILRLATDHEEIKKRLLNAGFLKEQKLSLSDYLLDPSRAEDAFKISLQKLLYHDLDRVEPLYKMALRAEFFPPDPTIRSELEAAVRIRHDCVHRNGKSVDGTLHEFDDALIRALSQRITTLVDHVEEKATAAVDLLSKDRA